MSCLYPTNSGRTFFKFVRDTQWSEVSGMVGVSRMPGAIVEGEVSFRASMPGRG